MTEAERNLIEAALRLDRIATEFEGDLTLCEQYLTAFFDACEAVRTARNV
jgi:hypothetical protein